MNRRQFLRRSGCVGLLTTGRCRSQAAGTADPSGPPSGTDWALAFEDTFESGTLDTDNWGIGWGWGQNTSISDTRIDGSNVEVSDGLLRLRATHDGSQITSGGINTKDRVTFGPGSYLEAQIRFAGRQGFHNAFWSKPNSEAWPPEIDVVEQWHSERTNAPARHSHHHIHYPTSGEPGDNSTHRDLGTAYEPGDDVTENFHAYGVEWRSDRIIHYVDGEQVAAWTGPTMLTSMGRGAPFYMMVNLNVNSVGTADTGERWTEEMAIDYVRLWETSESTSERHYLWARSATGEPARFAFRTSGGDIELDTSQPNVDYWVSADGTTAGGTATGEASLPGFWYDGRITDLSYEGPLDLFIDDEQVDPEAFVDESTVGPPIVDI